MKTFENSINVHAVWWSTVDLFRNRSDTHSIPRSISLELAVNMWLIRQVNIEAALDCTIFNDRGCSYQNNYFYAIRKLGETPMGINGSNSPEARKESLQNDRLHKSYGSLRDNLKLTCDLQ